MSDQQVDARYAMETLGTSKASYEYKWKGIHYKTHN